MAIRRPNPLLWLYYQYGGRLPAAYREWVLHDGICRTWMLRAAVRRLLQIAPILGVLLAILVVLGGSWPIALGSVLLGFLVLFRFALAYSAESVDSRLVRYGYPPGHASALRQQAAKAEAARRRAARRPPTP